MTIPEQRQELLELAGKARPRPWKTWVFERVFASTQQNRWDIEYFVTAANLAPGLARDVERLTKAIDAMRQRFCKCNYLQQETKENVCTACALAAGEEKK